MSFDSCVPLSSVAELVSTKAPVSALGGHPYVSTENLLPNLGGLGKGEMPSAGRVNSFNKFDTLFSNIRPYFRKVFYAQTVGGCSADVLVFRSKNPDEFLPAYLYYCLADPTFVEYTMASCKGAKMPRGDKSAMLQYQVAKPSLVVQAKISNILRTVDESIEALQHQNAALESIAQTIFSSWFVRFDPVHAKAAGITPEAMSAQLAELFPSEFEESELGLIPKGWSVAELGAHITAERGLSYKGSGLSKSAADTPMHNLNSVLEGGGYKYSGIKRYAGAYKERHFVEAGDIVVANTEQGHEHRLIGFPAIIPLQHPKGIYSHHLYRVAIKPESELMTLFLYYCLMSPVVRPQIIACTNGSTVNMLKPEGLARPRFACPPSSVASAFETIVSPLRAQMEHNVVCIEQLTELRDHLLPRLISGKLSLEDAQEAVEELIPA